MQKWKMILECIFTLSHAVCVCVCVCGGGEQGRDFVEVSFNFEHERLIICINCMLSEGFGGGSHTEKRYKRT